MPPDAEGDEGPGAVRTPLVSMRGLVKRYGAVTAADGVDLDIYPGEVLALLGENGAGKSTLMRMLYGLQVPDAGQIAIAGRPVAFGSPIEAMGAGIGMVFQQFSLVPALSVLENLLVAWPGAPWWQPRAARRVRQALVWLHRLAPSLDPDRRVDCLAVGERQIVELAKVLNLDPRLVILDEPTSVLTPAEAGTLHGFVRDLARSGKAVVLITHKIADVTACADRIAVMRRGRLVDQGPLLDRSATAIVTAMVGQEPVAEAFEPPPADTPRRLRIRALTTSPAQAHCPVQDLSLDVAAGEIVGVAGVIGNGQVALAEALVGLERVTAGEAVLDGVVIASQGIGRPNPTTAIAYIPERPIDNAVVASLDLAANLDLWRLRRQPLFGAPPGRIAAVSRLLARYDVRPPDPALAAAVLSGGNLQKLVIARELSGAPTLILACYPTMGLDATAANAVRQAMFDHARRGAAVLWISEDLDDLLAHAHRVAVLHRGRIAGVLSHAEATRDGIGRMMAGLGDRHVA